MTIVRTMGCLVLLLTSIASGQLTHEGTATDLPKKKQTSLGLYVTAAEAYAMWKTDPVKVSIIDVRTPEEYMFVGHAPMARNIPAYFLAYEWDEKHDRPAMRANPEFTDSVRRYAGPNDTVLLMCRSGTRSSKAVNALAEAGFTKVYTVVDGFEGDLVKAERHPDRGRRTINGWRNSNLPWTYDLDRRRMYLPPPTEKNGRKRSAVPAGINDRFVDPGLNASDWLRRWEVESREIYACRHDVVSAIGLDPGATIADIGSGTGLFVAPFSEAVGAEGKVLALDIAPKFVEHIAKRSKEEGLANVTAILSKEDSTELPPNSIDVAFVCDTYHHFEYHEPMLASIRRALRPEGQLIVIDFERIPGKSRQWVLGHVRAGKSEFSAEIEQAGFRREEEVVIPGFRENYFLRFRKR